MAKFEQILEGILDWFLAVFIAMVIDFILGKRSQNKTEPISCGQSDLFVCNSGPNGQLS